MIPESGKAKAKPKRSPRCSEYARRAIPTPSDPHETSESRQHPTSSLRSKGLMRDQHTRIPDFRLPALDKDGARMGAVGNASVAFCAVASEFCWASGYRCRRRVVWKP